MDSENPASESEKAEQFSPDQENDIILTTNETPLLKKVDKTEDAFELAMDSESEKAEQVLPDTSTQDDDFILIVKRTRNSIKFFKCEAFKVNLNLTEYWTNFSFKTIDKIAILSTVLYIFDIGSDGSLSYNFLHGANYTKTVANVTDTAITDFQCTQISQTYHNLTDQTTHTFNCFEQDIIWGATTLGIMALTGYLLLVYLHLGFNRSCCFLQKVTYVLFWPFYILFVKAASIFVAGQDDWKSANMILTGFEGFFEAQFQFMLQLFIVFVRSDREISNLQILTIASSLMSIVSTKIEGYFVKKPKTTIKTKAKLIILFLASSIFDSASSALMIATLRCYSVSVLVIGTIFLYIKMCFASRLKTKSGRFFDANAHWTFQALCLIATAILVNCFSSSIQILTLSSEGFDYIYLSDIDIVKSLSYFNTIFVLCLSSFAIYLPLYYFQMMIPRMEEEEAKKEGVESQRKAEAEEEARLEAEATAKATIQERENNANENENESTV